MTWGVEALTVRLGQRTVLKDVSLDVEAGRIVSVVGGDGSGKTTLLRALAGVLFADQGEVRRPPPHRIGYLPATSGVYDDLTVMENLLFSGTVYGLAQREVIARSRPLLDRAGLSGAEERLGRELSGGMRQKLGVIRALLHKPDLLVLDEPSTGVDPVSRADLWRLIAHAAAEGAAVVVATTYLDEAERGEEILFLHEGRALAAGTPEEICAKMPGRVYRGLQRPGGKAAERAWRRGRDWRLWCEPGTPAPGEPWQAVDADLEDVLTVFGILNEQRSGRGELI